MKMKKRFLALLLVMSVLFTVPVYAASARTVMVAPSIKFDGTQATCAMQITADKTTDQISATMELWQGNTLINSWSGSGTWILSLSRTTTVSKNKTYTLTVNYSVNGVAKNPVSISRTNS